VNINATLKNPRKEQKGNTAKEKKNKQTFPAICLIKCATWGEIARAGGHQIVRKAQNNQRKIPENENERR